MIKHFAADTANHALDVRILLGTPWSDEDLRNPQTLILDSRVLGDQQLNEGRQQRFASLADIVNELEETQVEREFLLGNAPMWTKPTPK